MPRLGRVEIWSDLACNSGERLGVVRDVIEAVDEISLDGRDKLRLVLPRQSNAWQYVQEQRVIRVWFVDNSWQEWRIVTRQQRRQPARLTAELEGEGILLDLRRGFIERIEASGAAFAEFEVLGLTPTEIIDTILLPVLPSYFDRGTVDPTDDVALPMDGSTPLKALKELATKTGTELAVRRNGITGYYIDLVNQIGASAPEVALRVGKNVGAIRYRTDARQQVTRVYPRGGSIDDFRLNIGDCRWKVVSVSTNNVVLVDPNSSEGPIAFDDQFNGFYLEAPNGTDIIAITDTIESSQTVVVADGTKFTADDIVRIRRNSSGDELTYLDAPSQQSTYGVIPEFVTRNDIAWVRNLVANSMLNGTYTGGVPASWSKVGSTGAGYSENTNALYTRSGGKSCKVTSVFDGDGLESAAISIVPTEDRPYFSGFFSLWVTSGRIRVEIWDVTNQVMIPTGEEGRATNSVINGWVDLGLANIDFKATNTSSIKLRIVQDGNGAAEFYVDTCQLTQSVGQQPFYPRDAATELWFAAQNRLLDDADPRVDADVDLLDLYRLDEARWPYSELVLGGDVRLIDSTLSIDLTTRITRIQRNLLTDVETFITLSNSPKELTDVVLRPVLRKRFGVDADAKFDRIGVADPTIGPEQPNDEAIIYPVEFDRDTAYIEVYTTYSDGSTIPTPPETSQYFAGFVYPDQSQIEIATPTNYYRKTVFVAYTKDGIRGRTVVFGPTQAQDAGTAPTGAPSWAGTPIDQITDTSMRLNWTNGDPSAYTRIWRNGQVVKTVNPGVTQQVMDGLTPETEYTWDLDHIKNGQTSAKAGEQTESTTAQTLDPPQYFFACGRPNTEPPGQQGVKMVWQNGDSSAQTVIDRAPDVSGSPGTWVNSWKIVSPGVEVTYDASEPSGTFWFRAWHQKVGWEPSSKTSADDATYYDDEICPE